MIPPSPQARSRGSRRGAKAPTPWPSRRRTHARASGAKERQGDQRRQHHASGNRAIETGSIAAARLPTAVPRPQPQRPPSRRRWACWSRRDRRSTRCGSTGASSPTATPTPCSNLHPRYVVTGKRRQTQPTAWSSGPLASTAEAKSLCTGHGSRAARPARSAPIAATRFRSQDA